jgi:hypothetical protein
MRGGAILFVFLLFGTAAAEAPGPCARAPTGALALRPYESPCPLPGTDGNGLPGGYRAPAADTPGLPYEGAVTLDSEADFARIYQCKQPSGISWTRDRLLVYRGPGDSATMVAPRWVVVDGKKTVLSLRWSERCQGVPPSATAVALAILVPRSAPRAAVAKICHPPEPPCLAP